jgi:hypothetical protein
MPHRYAGGMQIVVVTMPKALNEITAPTTLWIAAVPRDRAVAAVRAEVPVACLVELLERYLTPDQVAKLNLRPGQVREFSSIAPSA